MQSLLRFEVMEANLFCRDLVVKYGYDVLDLHYYLRNQVHRYRRIIYFTTLLLIRVTTLVFVFFSSRMEDGIHYNPLVLRFVTNLILTHICKFLVHFHERSIHGICDYINCEYFVSQLFLGMFRCREIFLELL